MKFMFKNMLLILSPGSLRDQSAQVNSWTAKGERADCRSHTASGTGRSNTASETDLISGSRHPGTFPTRGEVSAQEYYSAIKNKEFMKFLGKWMELENIILSEVTQSQKNTYNMHSLISGY